MSTRDAESFRQRHRGQCIAPRAPSSAPEFPRQATELRRLEQLPWPRNLFGELASIAELMAESEHGGQNADSACLFIPPFNAVCPSSEDRARKGSCTTSEREKTLTGVDCAVHHENAVQPAEIASSVGGSQPPFRAQSR
jgi:hypothetical protein